MFIYLMFELPQSSMHFLSGNRRQHKEPLVFDVEEVCKTHGTWTSQSQPSIERKFHDKRERKNYQNLDFNNYHKVKMQYDNE